MKGHVIKEVVEAVAEAGNCFNAIHDDIDLDLAQAYADATMEIVLTYLRLKENDMNAAPLDWLAVARKIEEAFVA